MFNLSGSEIVVILLLALVILGPEKLPDAIRRAGRTYSELKKMGNSFQTEMKNALDEPMKEMRETADLLRSSAQFDDGDETASGPAGRGSAAPPKPPVRRAAPAPAAPSAPRADDGADDGLINRTLSGADHVAAPPPSDGDALIDRTLSGGIDPPADTAGEPAPAADDAATA